MSDPVKDARYLSPSAQEALRMQAVAALAEGCHRDDVAAVFKVSPQTVDIWWAKWLAGGREALIARPRGRRTGEHQVLSAAEQQTVRQAILDYQPCDLGFDGQLWTRPQVGALIARVYQVRLTDQGVGKYLRRWGLAFQRPDQRAVGQHAEAVRVWQEVHCPALRSRARAETAEVLFVDRVGIRSNQVAGSTWGERGRTPIARRSDNRFSANAISAISVKGRAHFMVCAGTFDALVMCRFLDRLAGHFDGRVHLIVDGNCAHRSVAVRDWLSRHADRIELHLLPSYAPELGPGGP